MRRVMQHQRSAERLGLAVRWVVLTAAALMSASHFSEAWFAAGFAVLAASNVVGMRLCGRESLYERAGRRYMTAMRLLDSLILTLLCFEGPLEGEKLWLLAIPTVLCEGLISRSPRSVVALVFAGSLIPVAHGLQQGNLQTSSAAALTLIAAGLGSLVLSTYRERERVLQARDERLRTVLDCTSALAASNDLRSMIRHTLRAAIEELDADRGYVMLTSEEDKGFLLSEVAYGVGGAFEFPDRLPIGTGVTGYAVKMGQPIAIHDRDSEQLDLEGVGRGARSIVSVPLVAREYMGPSQAATEHVLGAITLLGNSADSFSSADDMTFLRSLASLVAEAVANARMEERQRTTFLKILETLAKSLEARDIYTRGHSQRVSEVSLLIGEQMGLTSEALEELRVGTILHDIGKIGVPDSILNKPARLTDEEFAVMKTHPVIGYEICKPLGLSEGVLMIIRNHHEKLDGSGYPDGLKGGELPLSLRIVCVADAFDAMSSRRPYRDVMAMSRVLGELSAGAGVQFDPVVVEVLRDLLHTPAMLRVYAGQWSDQGSRAA